MNIFTGTTGNDRFVASKIPGAQAFDWVQGIAGDDSFLLDGLQLFIWPGAGNDRIETTSPSGLWVIYRDSPIGIDYAQANGRIVDGWGGFDTLVGGNGPWTVEGTEFADRYVFSSGFVMAMGGDDNITIGGSFTGVDPGAGNDTVVDVGSFNLIRYADAPGAVSGNLASGTISDGWGGIDTLVGVTRLSLPTAGSDLIGSLRDETFIVARDGRHRFDGGGGQDRVEWSATRADVTFSLLPDGWIEARNRTNSDVLTLRNVESLKLADHTFDLTRPLNFTGHDFYAFRSEPMPSLSSFYGLFPSQSQVAAITLIPVDLDGNGRPEIVLELWQRNLVIGAFDLGPVPNQLVILSQGGNGEYEIATSRFLSPGAGTVMSGLIRQNQVGDVNGDGHPDLVFATNKEDGRDGNPMNPATDNDAQADVLLSNPATGLYRIASFGVPNWNHGTTLAPPFGPWPGLAVTAGFGAPPTVVTFGATTTTSAGPADMNAGTLRHLPWLDDAVAGARYFYADVTTPPIGNGVPALWAWHPDGQWSKVAQLDSSRFHPTGEIEWTTWTGTTQTSTTFTFRGQKAVMAGHDTTALWHPAPGVAPLVVSKLNVVELTDPNATVVNQLTGGTRVANYLDFLRFDRNGLAQESVPVRDEETVLNANFMEVLDLDRDGYEDIVVYAYRQGGQPVVYLNDTRGGLYNAHIENFLPRAPDDWSASAKFLDANGDALLDLLYWPANGARAGDFAQAGAQYQLHLAQAAIGTGPGHVNSADLGAPGFNEAFYLGTYADARKAVSDGVYATGLAHFLAVGRSQGYFGYSRDVWVHGSSLADTIVLREGNERAEGLAGDDTFKGGTGNDLLDGGAGRDTATYSTRHAAYSLVPVSGGYSIGGPDGTDSLISIERLQFQDAHLAFDSDGNAGQVYRLYKAAFARTPDLAGLGGWIAGMEAGLTLDQVATGFIGSAEFQNLYGANPTDAQFITLLYVNVLGRAPDAGGYNYWVGELSGGLQTRAHVLATFSETAENKAAVAPLIANGILYADAAQASGPARGQAFNGTPDADTLIGSVGNDTFNGAAGSDSIDGGAGIDTSLYGGNRSTHTVTHTGSGLTVSGGVDGTDTLLNVERLKFADIALAFDINGNAGQTYRLYQAAFDRTPDTGGLSDWIRGMDTGMTLKGVASGFIGSAEFQGLYGASPTDTQFVNLLYSNVLNRAPDQAGYDYWLGQMAGGMSREIVLIGFSESVENQAALIGVIQDGIAYIPA